MSLSNLPTNLSNAALLLQSANHAFKISPSIESGLGCLASSILTEAVLGLSLYPLLPTTTFLNERVQKILPQEFHWTVPVCVMSVATLAAHSLYTRSHSFLLKGVIFSVHRAAMIIFSESPLLLGMSLEHSLLSLTWKPTPFCEGKVKATFFFSDLAKVATFIASNFVFKGPIITNALAMPLSAITKVTTARFLERSGAFTCELCAL